jgi:protein SCO1/2
VTCRKVALLASVALAAGCGGHSQPPLTGVAFDRPAPNVSLTDEHGRAVSLRAFRGTVVVLAPTLTLCHEVCPITSGALEQIQYDARRAGVADRVTVLEVSVDPWRDTPARLRAYRRQTGVRFRLLTGTHEQLRRFWRAFGVGFYPTGHGKTFDVAHTDGVFLVDERGRERIAIIGMPNVHGRLGASLERRLGTTGRRNLRHPEAAWTVEQALNDLGRLLGKRIPEEPLP